MSSILSSQRMVITDLDGTLLSSDRTVSLCDLTTLKSLETQGIIRVIATGRSLYSAYRVLPKDFPIDYLVFSSGAGIVDWIRQELLLSCHLLRQEIEETTALLLQHGLDFMIHQAIPDNHHFWYHSTGQHNPDFIRRCDLYRDFASPFHESILPLEQACQFLTIEPEKNATPTYQMLKSSLPSLHVIRTTSPLDGTSSWFEIFPKSVSKASASEWLARRHRIAPANTLGLGNDYNDIEILQWAGQSFVVANAPHDLKESYPVVASHNDNGFSDAVKKWISC
ncbi:hypothetical protein CSA56_00640 [candidate division KSB3 bacterium]|uniref:Haloacid dehalogenase n=1 Tax=candidate division KSB3 bacterium TaxID=2044937 RepID=A0A2G6KLP3_9BACT|nr:MAG: hypothetical protein CSA56_00640 [candidate division KSB3 bacterium]